jgi:hypothetical protein
MSTNPDEESQSGPEPRVEANTNAASTLSDDVGWDLELAQPVLDLARSATEALDLANDAITHVGRDVQRDIAHVGPSIANSTSAQRAHNLQVQQHELVKQAADVVSSAATSDLTIAWRRFQDQNTERTRQTMDSIRSLADGIWPWIKKTANAAGEKIAELYRRAAPPNWTTDPAAAVNNYGRAVRLALDEGIPLAWVPDQDTVTLLLAVCGSGPARRAQLEAILDSRFDIILDCCATRLDHIASSSTTSPEQQRAVEFARQAVQALSLGLTAPAQTTATSLIDQLLHHAFTTIHGNYTHTSTPKRVQSLSQLASGMGLSFLGMLRELATMMPVFKAMTPWRPTSGEQPPKDFSRHVTAHHITAPEQVTRPNALIAVMLAVSLLSQEHDSGWSGWRAQRMIDAQVTALINNRRTVS